MTIVVGLVRKRTKNFMKAIQEEIKSFLTQPICRFAQESVSKNRFYIFYVTSLYGSVEGMGCGNGIYRILS